MAHESITRTAPGWEERTAVLLAPAARGADGAGAAVALRPGFARLAVLLDVTAFGGGSGLRVWLQHSRDGVRWQDLASFITAAGVDAQVAWIEAQPQIQNRVQHVTQGLLLGGTVESGFVFSRLRARWTVGGASHTFGVEAVAIYERPGRAGR